MISFFETEIIDVYVHRVGNKFAEEGVSFADKPTIVNEDSKAILKSMFLSKFQKENSVFKYSTDLLNVLPVRTAVYAANIDNTERSRIIVRHLYDVSNHPKIKGGEVFIVEFINVQYKGDLFTAIGVFKSENKETFLKSMPLIDGAFDIEFESNAISIDNIDKGALLLENGEVLCFGDDKTGYWKNDFLQLEVVNNDFNITTNTLNAVKNFISDKLDEEFDVAATDKVDLLNKSIKYFKDKENFDVDEFCGEVIGNSEASAKFKEYRSIYAEDFDELPDSFNISTAAVKKQSKSFKKVIKLDKNFHIYVHGNKELIEKDYDREKGLNFYKVYYKEEA